MPESPKVTETGTHADQEFREGMIAVTMKRRGCDRAEAEVILARIADRLDGYTHDEAVEMNPLPEGSA